MNRERRFLLLLAVLFLAAAPVRGQDIDDVVRGWIEKQHVPGVAIAVVKDGALIKAEGFGLANVEHRIPVRPDTVFKIGSLSKQFIAAGIMLLGQDGKIAVDDKISRHLEGTPKTWEAITLRHLLTHTAGLVREAPGFDEILKEPAKREMWTPVTLNDGRTFPYGFGWQLDDWPADSKVPTGVPMIRHRGSMNGFRAGYSRWPRQRLAVIVLTNLTNAPYEGLAANVAVTYAPQLRTSPRPPAAPDR